MSKMLMGQIDHARSRIKEITNEKLGDRPTHPQVPTAADFKEGVQDGTIEITQALLRSAIANWTGKEGRLTVSDSSSRWVNGNYVTVGGGKITSTKNGDLDEYLSYTYYRKVYEAAIATFDAEFEEYSRRRELIVSAATEVEDAIVLGDNAAALTALREFAAFTC